MDITFSFFVFGLSGRRKHNARITESAIRHEKPQGK